MRINYVLVDFENVQPDAVGSLTGQHFKVLVFVGANQAKVSFHIASSLQKLGAQAEYIKISGNGANALDFHIAYYIGRLAAEDSSSYFHIISKDKGFDPLIQHLKSQKILASRVSAISEISVVKASKAVTPAERVEVVLSKLQQPKATRPRTVKTLSNTVAAYFQKQLSDEEVEAIVRGLESKGYVAIKDAKVTYALPGDG